MLHYCHAIRRYPKQNVAVKSVKREGWDNPKKLKRMYSEVKREIDGMKLKSKKSKKSKE